MNNFGIFFIIVFFVCAIVPEFLALKRDTDTTFVETSCVQPPKPGKACKGEKPVTAFFFNVKTFRCASFEYLGCEGNTNRFQSFDDCIDSCQTPWLIMRNQNEEHSRKDEPSPDVCKLPPDAGNCKALIPMWFFDTKSKQCLTFSYGGCGGNGNKFVEEKDCLHLCGGEK